MPKKSKFRRRIAKWHRMFGVISALFICLLSVTGVLLNHTTWFNLDDSYVNSPWLLSLYGIEQPSIVSISLNDSWVSESDSRLYHNTTYLGQCRGSLVGVSNASQYWLAVCSEQLVLVSYDNVVVEKIDKYIGLPTPIVSFGRCGSVVCFATEDTRYRIDTDNVIWDSVDFGDLNDIDAPDLEKPPKEIALAIRSAEQSRLISVEKLIIDIHAGRYLGSLGPLFMDFIALVFILLALSGVYMWGYKRKKNL